MEETPVITLTPRALEHAQHLKKTVPEYLGLPLRLYLDGKGCDGFFYGVTFDARQAGDLQTTFSTELDLVVDPDTYVFVKGCEIDFVDDERGNGFLVNNPSQRKFRGKFYKKKEWLERLAQKKVQ